MSDPIRVTSLKMRPHYSQSIRQNATSSSGTSPLASYKEVPPTPRGYRTDYREIKILRLPQTANVRLKLRISQNRK